MWDFYFGVLKLDTFMPFGDFPAALQFG